MTVDTPFVPPHRRLALDGLDHLERYIRPLFGLPRREEHIPLRGKVDELL